ncbi:MAG TPA: class II aldolase/adducin family protein [Terriglobales bacterium]|nr:class II aldolase/adducin family protein [Terriglobales bacterium]
MHSDDLIRSIIATGRSLFTRGYAFGTAGNISCRVEGSIYCTATGCSLGDLSAEDIAVCNMDGTATSACKPTKELPLHLAAYRSRPECHAVVHLHSGFATAVSCLKELNTKDALPAFTPYYAMRVPCLPVIAYFPPGDVRLATELEKLAPETPAMLMRNHGSVALGRNLLEASALAEEIEETARLFFILGERGKALGAAEVSYLRNRGRA